MQDSTRPDRELGPIPILSSVDVPALVRERFDLEPAPKPATSDVLEALVDVLDRACELATPARTAARCLTVLARCRAALGTVHQDGGAGLISSLERLTGEWSQ